MQEIKASLKNANQSDKFHPSKFQEIQTSTKCLMHLKSLNLHLKFSGLPQYHSTSLKLVILLLLSNQTWQRKEWFSLSKAYFLQHWFTLLLLEVSDAHHIRHFLSFTPSHFHLHLFTLTLSFLSPPSRGMIKRDTDISSDGQGRKGELEQPTLRSKSWHVSPYSLATITEYVMRRKQQEHVGKKDLLRGRAFSLQ